MDYLVGARLINNAKSKLVHDKLFEAFPEGVQTFRRANRELTPEAKAKMIEIGNIFIDSINAKENEEKNKGLALL